MARRELDIDTNDNIHRHLFMGNICKKLVYFLKISRSYAHSTNISLRSEFTNVLLRTFPRNWKKNGKKYNLHINMSEFEFLSRNSSQISIYWRRSKISAYRRYSQNFLPSFQKICEKKYTLVYYFIEFSEKFSKTGIIWSIFWISKWIFIPIGELF